MAFLPKINIKTQENITLTQGEEGTIIAIMGTAQWGAIDEVKYFQSFANLLNYYKADASSLTLVRGADVAYTNGAFVVKALRIAGSAKAKSTEGFDGAGPTTDVLTFDGLYYGSYGDNVGVTILTQGTGRTVEITDGVTTERYTNNNAANGYTTNQAIADAINGVSELVAVTVKAGSETANLVDACTQTFLAGGNDGSTVAAGDYTTAFDNLLTQEDFGIMTIPGETDDSFHTTMVGKLNTRANNDQKYAMYFTGVAVDETITNQKLRTSIGNRLVICSPSMKYTPSFQTAQLTLDGSYLGCAVAGLTASDDVEISPTRKNLTVSSILVNSATGKDFYNNAEMEELLAVGIVPVSKINGIIKVARGVTRESDKTSVYYEINIRRIVDYIQALVLNRLDGFLGDPNLLRVREVIARESDGILEQAKLDEVIVNYEPTEVSEGLSPDTVIVNMSLQPTFAINFINVTLAINRLSE